MKSAMRKQSIKVQSPRHQQCRNCQKSMFPMKSAMQKQTINVQFPCHQQCRNRLKEHVSHEIGNAEISY